MNRNSVFRYMLRGDSLSKGMIAQELGLSQPTVAQCLNELLEVGLIKTTGTFASSGGRKAQSYTSIKDAKAAVGIDITLNHVNIVVTDLALNRMYSKRISFRLTDELEGLRLLQSFVKEAIKDSQVDPQKILGVGVSVPAIISGDQHSILGMHESMHIGLRQKGKILGTIKEIADYPMVLLNDANSAAKAEFMIHKMDKPIIYLFVSQSVGGAIMDADGNIENGENMRAGEFGHLTLYPGGLSCYCGRRGCINAYCNTKQLADFRDGNLETFFQSLEKNEKDVTEVWERYLHDLSLSIHNLITCFDRTIIIGGYLGQYIDKYMPVIYDKLKMIDPYLIKSDILVPAALKYEAAAMGAAAYYVDSFISSI